MTCKHRWIIAVDGKKQVCARCEAVRDIIKKKFSWRSPKGG